MPPVKGQTQARGRVTRKAILDAACSLFARNGYRGTSLAAIGDAVGLTQQGVLHHFPSKERLLVAVIDAYDRDHQALRDDIFRDGGIASLRRLPEIIDAIFEDPEQMRMFAVLGAENLDPDSLAHDYFVGRHRRVRGWFEAALRAGQATGEIRDDLDVAATGSEMLAFQDGLITRCLLDPAGIAPRQAYRRFIERLIKDVAPAGASAPLRGAPSPRRRIPE